MVSIGRMKIYSFGKLISLIRLDETNEIIITDEDPWLLLQRRFTTTNQELIETLARVEKLVSARPSGPDQHSASDITTLSEQFRCMILPTKKASRFFDRVDTFEKIDQVLGRKGSNTSFKSIALFGLGGLGKSSIAARYIERKIEENEYDAVFWVYGEKTASLRQSFTDIAMRLKLPGAQPISHDENLVLVQNWFQSTGKLFVQNFFQVISFRLIRYTDRLQMVGGL